MNTINKPRRMARPLQDDEGGSIQADGVDAPNLSSNAPAERRTTKQSLVVDLLHQEGGTSLAAIVEATGWLPHTARAALTGLRKKGHVIVRTSVDGQTRYAIAPAAAATE